MLSSNDLAELIESMRDRVKYMGGEFACGRGRCPGAQRPDHRAARSGAGRRFAGRASRGRG